MLIADDLGQLLKILPYFLRQSLELHPDHKNLIEIVMDLGRYPEARFPGGPQYLSNRAISWHDLDYAIKRIGNFAGDNRSGIERTLHRISSIRNRQGNIVGLTCRVGRAVFGTIGITRDLLEKGQSLLLLGRPGVGKTTAIREISRVLANEMEKRVVIIDTSNEIAGDGDIPHPSIGRARRMQVARPELQYQVMIEAVENHMPEVVIIDEIGTELEALAARTIAERGVQLVGTAHGNCLENLVRNPALADLVGGIQYVTLGDDEAKRRGTQKSILERKTSSTFPVAIEIHQRRSWIVHQNVDIVVDQILYGHYILMQRRTLGVNKRIRIQSEEIMSDNQQAYSNEIYHNQEIKNVITSSVINRHSSQFISKRGIPSYYSRIASPSFVLSKTTTLSLYPYLLSYSQINSIIVNLKLSLSIVSEISKADVILALRSSIKQNIKLRQIARSRHITIYAIRLSTTPQVTRALKKMLCADSVSRLTWLDFCLGRTSIQIQALLETKWAIEKIVVAKKQPVELVYRLAELRKLQHELVYFYNFQARSLGEEPRRRLCIYPK